MEASGDFIYSGVFAPLLHRCVAYTAAPSDGSAEEWTTGKVARPLIPLEKASELHMVAPNGDAVLLPPHPVLGGILYDAGLIALPGIYDLKEGDRIVARFAANIPQELGRMQRTDLKTLGKSIGEARLLVAEGETLKSEIESTRFGREYWKPIALMFLLLLLTESTIGRPMRSELTPEG